MLTVLPPGGRVAGEHTVAPLAGERRRVQLRARPRVLRAPQPHVPRLRDARAEPLRLPEAEQVPAAAAPLDTTHRAAGTARATRIAVLVIVLHVG